MRSHRFAKFVKYARIASLILVISGVTTCDEARAAIFPTSGI